MNKIFSLLIIALFLCTNVYAVNRPLRMEETDGDPVATRVNNIKIGSGITLTKTSNTEVTLTSGGAVPGNDTEIVFNDGGSFGADTGLTYAKATNDLTIGSAEVDCGAFTMIKGAQTGDPQVTHTVTADANGDYAITADTGDITLTAGDDLNLYSNSKTGTYAYFMLDGTNIEIGTGTSSSYLTLSGPSSYALQLTADEGNDQYQLGVTSAIGKQIIICAANQGGADFDHADTGYPFLYFHDMTNPNITNNKYGAIGHNSTGGLLIKTGAYTGAGSSPVSINNYISFQPQEVEQLRLSGNGDLRLTRAEFVDEMWNGIDAAWATDVTTGSVAAQALSNGRYRLTTGATATNEESIDFSNILVTQSTLQPTFEIALDLEEVSDTEVEVGLKESDPGADPDDYIMMAFDPSAQNTWYLEASTGGSTTTDQGAVADTNDIILRFEFTSDTALEWFINDTSQGVVTSNVPTVALQPFIRIRTEADAAHYIDVDFVKLWSDRS